MVSYIDFKGLQTYHNNLSKELSKLRNEDGKLILNCTQEEYDLAVESGLIEEGMVVNIIDDYEEEVIEPINADDIKRLFN